MKNSVVFDGSVVVIDQLFISSRLTFCNEFAKVFGIFQNRCYICTEIDKIRGINIKSVIK